MKDLAGYSFLLCFFCLCIALSLHNWFAAFNAFMGMIGSTAAFGPN